MPNPLGWGYRAGLVVVAAAMVALPLVYIGLIALTAWGVVWHLSHDTWILEGASGRSSLLLLLLYIAPAVTGLILVFFMVKPFFAARPPQPEVVSLDPATEPMLFAFVERICRLVGAPVPGRIDVDCEVNASASLRRGILSRELVLTIGLPLAAGLNLREFAGVLAHEFGHFAQGAGMRLTYVIRWINHWFARVVHERDAWDLKLEAAAKETDLRIGFILHLARGGVWLTRRILWVFMHAGHAISCFMLRQMEYDADGYEARLAGSEAFASTARRLRTLGAATRLAYDDVKQSWTGQRLPENIPLLIEHKATHLPDELRRKLDAAGEQDRTRWYDTHPCDADRVRSVQQLQAPGVFRLEVPAQAVFADFTALSRRVTRHQYEKQFKLEFTDANLMPAEEILRESAASSQADAMVRKFFGRVNLSFRPLLADEPIPAVSWKDPAAKEAVLARWREACRRMEAVRAEAEAASEAVAEPIGQRARLTAVHWMTRAGFRVEPVEAGLPATAVSAGEQEAASLMAVDQLNARISADLLRVDPFMSALRERVTLALSWALRPGEPPDAPGAGDGPGIGELLRVTTSVAPEMAVAHRLASRLQAYVTLAGNIGNSGDPAEAERVLTELGAGLNAEVDGLQKRFAAVAYPFRHARGAVSIAEFLRGERKGENRYQQTYVAGDSHVDQLFALHYRLVGRLLAVVDEVERKWEQGTDGLEAPGRGTGPSVRGGAENGGAGVERSTGRDGVASPHTGLQA